MISTSGVMRLFTSKILEVNKSATLTKVLAKQSDLYCVLEIKTDHKDEIKNIKAFYFSLFANARSWYSNDQEKIAFETISKFWDFPDFEQGLNDLDSISGIENYCDLIDRLLLQNMEDKENLYFPTCAMYSEVKKEFENLSPSELLSVIKFEFLNLGGKL